MKRIFNIFSLAVILALMSSLVGIPTNQARAADLPTNPVLDPVRGSGFKAITPNAWNALGTTPLNSLVFSIATSGSDVYAGGYFTDAGGDVNADYIAKWDGTSWSALGTTPLNGYIYSIAISGSDVYAGGSFTDAGGDANADYIARWDGTSWSALGTTPLNYDVRSIVFSGTDMYVGGNFTDVGGDANADYIARWDGTSWFALGAIPLNGITMSIAISGTDVYAGGSFTDAGGDVNADRIAKWDGISWSALGTTPLNNFVLYITSKGTNIYAGGWFTDAGGDTNADFIAKWDGATWSALGTTPLNSNVLSIAISGTDVYAGGYFTDAGGDGNADRIAKWNGTSWSALGTTPLDNTVRSIAISGTDLYAGGGFIYAGGDANANFIAMYSLASAAVSIDNTSWNFGDQTVSTSSADKTFTLTNSGSVDLIPGTLNVSGEFHLSSDNCSGQTVAAGNNCTFGVSFSPLSTGTKSGSVSIPSNAATSPDSISLSGNGTPTAPDMDVVGVCGVSIASGDMTPSLADCTDFGTSFGAGRRFYIYNHGTAALNLSGSPIISIGGTNASDFSITSFPTGTIAPGGYSSFFLNFNPTAEGLRTATISIDNNVGSKNPYIFAVQGTGKVPLVTLNPTTGDFGDQLVGTTSAANSFTLTNTGSAPLIIGAGGLLANGQFTLSNNNCANHFLSPNVSCTFDVAFSPTSTGAKTGSISISSSSPTSPDTLPLSGNGIAPAMELDHTSWDFSNTYVGSDSFSTPTLLLTNIGNSDLVIGTVSIGGSSDFHISDDTCSGATITSGNTCYMAAYFHPTSGGVKTGSISIPSNASTSPDSILFSGTGVVLVPPGLFGKVSPADGATDIPASITLSWAASNGATSYQYCLFLVSSCVWKNNGTNTSVDLSGLSYNTKYSWQVRAYNADGMTNADSSTFWSFTTENAPAPVVELNPTAWNFGDQMATTASAAKSFTLTNTGTAALNIGTLGTTGQFALTNDLCSGQAVAASGTCTFEVTFSPLSTGAKSGSISIPSDAATTPDIISLSGNGTPADVTAPTVTSIVRVDPSPTNLSSVDFTVTFSEAVTGVDEIGPSFKDFNLTTSSAISGASITAVSGSGTTYTVTVNTGTGNGTIRLDAVAGGIIVDAALNPFAVGFTNGQVYSVIRTATFSDVSLPYWANSYIERLYMSGITSGCSSSPLSYCPTAPVTRAQIAVLLLRGIHGVAYTPPLVSGSTGFNDVAGTYWAAAWIKELAAEGITSGCGGGNYCPDASVTRAQIAIMLVRATHGVAFVPSTATGIFSDVSVGSFGADYIEQLSTDDVTNGCGGGNYCPGTVVTRAQLAVFVVRAFHLP